MSEAKKRVAGSWTYVPLADRALPPEKQTVFTLSPLDGAERERAADESIQRVLDRDGNIRVVSRMRSVAREIVLTHVTSIERFPASAPKAWPADMEARKKYLEDMDDDLVFEVGNHIWERSALGPEEAKQVGESSTPAPTST